MPGIIVIGSSGPIIIIELGGVEMWPLRPIDLEKIDVAATTA